MTSPEPETDPEEEQAVATLLLTHYSGMEKRVRLLTWAVVALAAYVILKEI